MPGNYTLRRTYVDGDILSAADYVADHQQHIDNQTPQGTDDYSANVTQMRTVTSPGTVNGESLATSLAGELERIRFAIREMKGKIAGSTVLQWYDPSYSVAVPNASVTAAKLADGATFIQYLRATNGAPGVVTGAVTVVSQAIVMTRTRARLKGTCNLQLIAGNGNVTTTLRRGATIVATLPDFVVASDTSVNIDFIDNPGPGTYTYNLVVEKTAGAGTITALSSSISVEEVA